MDNLKMIWHNQLVEDSFCKLKSLQVEYCYKLLTLFPSNMCERLLSLESLEVSGCVSLQEIFDLQGIIFKEGNSIAAATQSRELSFSNLQNLTIFVCPSLKNLFAVANEGVSAQQVPARFCFSKLTSLKLDILPELRNFCPGRHIVKCPVLKTLDLSEVWDLSIFFFFFFYFVDWLNCFMNGLPLLGGIDISQKTGHDDVAGPYFEILHSYDVCCF
ncbi:hypothetical protein ACOSQ3_008905 [Xanthoceras sorbifolium]